MTSQSDHMTTQYIHWFHITQCLIKVFSCHLDIFTLLKINSDAIFELAIT